ncbi:acyl-coenzyme A oxidase 1 [Cucurbitaria berberidis CBS 394.84]|uniref:Acyl-coenzyme A oxidase n=1 Tax=Cucurbitaria berberidis CBS 394.84 TaxID=1168544 RepID=A0A9P4LCV9_9PLEO|nr:acyl-coenzyme A oxidase 1 [Cucurbitaria berberidis CBS 394.84]KAF1849772.1 acyl-coenzyme A oxidase 1 [Cucurbitaria berberidis CBS 394.84]
MTPTPDWVKQLKPSGVQGHELLKAERANSAVPVHALQELLHTKDVIVMKQKLLDILKAEKVFDKSQNYFMGRTDRFERALAREKRLRILKKQHNWSLEEFRTAADLIGEPGPYGLHDSMFKVTLEGQATPEQQEKWLTQANDYKIIGCYAQTELGHGSNVRGLETTATWNAEDKTFTIHSPHLTASKWWIGSLGRTANYAVVMAQLIIAGKSYGPAPFCVQIRDLKTHEPLENIHIGDIGPKFGYNTMDNGFLLFNHVKVPHISHLARYTFVDPSTNKFGRRGSPSLVYGTLTWVRSTIVMQAGSVLARGVTIATRYCAVRRQFQDRDAPAGEAETPVLNYTMVQIRLLPLLAATFALHFTGKSMMDMYQENQKKIAQGNANKDPSKRGAGPEEVQSGSDMLADLHASSCALKSLSSSIAAEGLEVCRRACGGHGYSSFSGIGPWYADYLPTTTWEGDNYMLTQQVARYLLKSARSVLNGEKPTNDTTTILTDFHNRRNIGCAFDIIGSDTELVAAFAWRVSFLTFEASKHRDEQKKPWNDLLVDFYRLSKAHAQYMVVKTNLSALKTIEKEGKVDATTLDVLTKLFRLFALHTLEQESSEFYASGACSKHQISLARTNTVMKLLKDIRPHAVRLVDAWGFDDWVLDSSLGREDGKVYEDMFYRASELNPLNNITVDPYPESSVLFKRVEKSKL